ncbi:MULTISPECIES: GNAT family N-acetyltransferase [unclassified Streptomyces]|uniref:GNAT family N-acetyltransferase n=1 Tax=unclassified Streptomyces TaxID=2593676 RepID=UPI003D7331D7
METWGGDQVEAAVASCTGLLRTVTARDWAGTRAGRVEWSCRESAEHIAADLFTYAGRLAARAPARVPFRVAPDDGTGNADVVDVIAVGGALLAATLRATPRSARAFHPYPFRSANREGFAAMGVAEVLLHTHDIAEGLGVPYEPPAGLCEGVLTRIFPRVRPAAAPWPALLWATGRGDLPGRAPVTEWRWHNNLVLPTDRLTLEGLTPAAAADLRAGGDGGFTWLGGAPLPGARDAAGLLLKAYGSGVHQPEFGVFVVVRRDDDRAVGSIGFHGRPDEEGRVEVGYDLVEPARGHGYATEALRTLAEWALARDDVQALGAVIDDDNPASQRVAGRAGFTPAPLETDRAAREPRGEAPAEPRLFVRRG